MIRLPTLPCHRERSDAAQSFQCERPGQRNGVSLTLSAAQLSFLSASKVGHLATADAAGAPHVVPVCYTATAREICIPIDEKPKSGDPMRLKRLRNIAANPAVAFVVDHYDDRDWSRLGWIMIRGPAEILRAGPGHARALKRLRRRYPQYREMALTALPVIAIRIAKLASWGRIEVDGPPGTP